MALNHLLFSTLDEIKLDVSVDSLPCIWSWNAEKSCPFLVIRKDVTDDLCIFELSRSFKDLDLFVSLVGNAYMIDWSRCNNWESSLVNPSPENDVLGKLNVFKFGLLVQIKNLEDVSFSFIWSFQGNNILLDMHDGPIDFASWSLYNVHFVEKFYNTELRSIVLINISYTDILLRLEVCNVEFKEFRIYS